MKNNIAILGASYLQLPLILKAKEMGYCTHVFAWETGDVGEKASDFFYPISIIEKDEILKKCKEIGIVGICSIASDLAMVTVNYVAQNLGLPSNSMECTSISTNKHLMRCCFDKNGDPSPKSIVVTQECLPDIDFKYPLIVKPTDRSGSRGVTKVQNRSCLKEAIKNAIEQSFEKKAVVEEFVEGDEYSVECISFHGNHSLLAITKKYTTGAPFFIETGHMEPAPISKKLFSKIKKIVFKALDSLKISTGASHTEIKIDEKDNISIIEIGGRMGGDCIGSDLVHYSSGYDYLRMVIECACDIKPTMSKDKPIGNVYVRFILTNADLDTFLSLKKEHPEKIIRIPDFNPERIGKTTDSSNRAGCYIFIE